MIQKILNKMKKEMKSKLRFLTLIETLLTLK